MELSGIFLRLGIALGLGLLVGLQRQRAASRLAGLRTFPLVTLFGALSALLAQSTNSIVIAAGVIALAAAIVVGNILKLRTDPEPDPGLTTEIAVFLMYAIGAFLFYGPIEIAVVLGGVVAVLLQFKVELHGFAGRLDDRDLRAIFQFVLLSLVILPVLPNRTFGPLDVLNPYKIWVLVVLIVGISLGGYILYKFFGHRAGALLGGILGGIISSTATTVSYARRTSANPETTPLALLTILLSSAVSVARVVALIALVAPNFLRSIYIPLLIFTGIFLIESLILYFSTRKDHVEMPPQGNPTELKTAFVFGGLFALVLLAVAAAKMYLGDRGLYFVAALSGLTDMDAITLSTSQFVLAGRLLETLGARLLLIAILANLVFKAGAVAVLGHRSLFLRVAAAYAVVFVTGLLFLFL